MSGKNVTKKMLKSILISYIVILLVFAGVWMLAMRWMRTEIQGRNAENYGKALEILANSVDRELQIVERQALNVALSGESKTMLTGFAEGRKNILQVKSVMDHLAAGMQNQDIMKNCYLYILNSDYVVAYNTTAEAEIYYRTYVQEQGISFSDWNTFVYGITENGYLELKTEESSVLYYAYLMPVKKAKKEAVVLIQISNNSILGKSGQGEQLADIGVEIVADNGLTVVSCAEERTDAQIITVQSAATGWYYRGYVWNGDINGSLRKLTLWLFGGIAASAGICMLMLAFSLRRHYVPLKRIMESLEAVEQEPRKTDSAYHYIEDSLKNLISTQRREQLELKLQGGKLREVYLQYLFSGRCRPEYIREEDLTFFELGFVTEGFCLAFFATGGEREACQGISLEKAGITYMGEPVLYGVYAGVREGAAGYFLSESEAKNLREKADGLLLKVRGQGEILTIYASGIHRGGNDISLAWGEVNQLMKNSSAGRKTGLFLYDEFCREKRKTALKEEMLQYIAENYTHSDLTVESVCAALNKSVSTVNKLMKDLGEEGPLYYINKKRISEAERIFRESGGTQPVKNVMQQVGIENAGSFIRIFKKYTGVTPGEYQKMCRNREE